MVLPASGSCSYVSSRRPFCWLTQSWDSGANHRLGPPCYTQSPRASEYCCSQVYGRRSREHSLLLPHSGVVSRSKQNGRTARSWEFWVSRSRCLGPALGRSTLVSSAGSASRFQVGRNLIRRANECVATLIRDTRKLKAGSFPPEIVGNLRRPGLSALGKCAPDCVSIRGALQT